MEAGVINLVGCGIDNIKCLAPTRGSCPSAVRRYEQVSRIGSAVLIARKTGQPASAIMTELFTEFLDGKLAFANAPNKVIFYTHASQYADHRDDIIADLDHTRHKREANFERLIEIIVSDDPEGGIYSSLNI